MSLCLSSCWSCHVSSIFWSRTSSWISPNHGYCCLGFGKLINVLLSRINREASWPMSNIETFPLFGLVELTYFHHYLERIAGVLVRVDTCVFNNSLVLWNQKLSESLTQWQSHLLSCPGHLKNDIYQIMLFHFIDILSLKLIFLCFSAMDVLCLGIVTNVL